MQFRVPQFIDMEDKVIGPLTLRQFGYIIGAGGFSFIIWTFIPIKTIAVLLILIVSSLFIALAFLKVNHRTFGEILESAFSYYTGSKIYTWKQPDDTKTGDMPVDQVVLDAKKEVAISKVNQNRLHDIALGLDVFDHTPRDE